MPDDELKERIRNAVDIVEVVGERVPLKKAGKNFVARCPFHTEKTPSFNVNPERQIYHCFGCGVGGDVFAFVMAYDKVSFPEALRALAERAGIPLTDERSVRRKVQEDAHDIYYQANALAREFFVATLADPKAGAHACTYLASRGLTNETIRKFGLGYAPDTWDGFLNLARSKGLSPKVLIEAGLLVKGERGTTYDRFRGRITFPIVNPSGRVVAFGARTLDPEGQPKYLNSSESPVYQKGRLLYGLFHARDAIREQGYAMVVEGYMDVIGLAQAGLGNVVATCGTALSREHGDTLRRHTERIVLVFDGDDAGVQAAVRAGDVLLEAGIEAFVVLLPKGEDPDTFVAAKGPEALRELATGAAPHLQFRWAQLRRQHDMATAVGRNRAIGDMLDAIAPVQDELLRTLMATQVADWGATDERLVMRAVAKRRERGRPRREEATERPAGRARRWDPPQPEKQLVAWAFDRPWVCHVIAEMGLDCITDPILQKIADALIRLAERGAQPSAANLLDEKPDDLAWAGVVARLGQVGYDDREIEKAVTELVASLQLPQVKHRLDALRARLRAPLDPEARRVVYDEFQEARAEYVRLNGIIGRDAEG